MVGEGGNAKDKEDITFVRDENDKIIGNIHTIELYLWYDSYFGDSLTASRLSVYELGDAEKELNENNAYYTDINPEEFYTPQNLLGTKAYTAVDLSVKDSIRNLSTYVPSVHVSFKDEAAIRIGREIIQHAYKAGTNFDNKAFREAFKGIYVKSDYGDGTILVVYKSYAIDTIKGTILPKTVVKDGESPDSTYYGYRMFTSTREVIQANQLKNDNTAIQDCIKKDGWTYLKSPAGIFTQITLPINKIADQLQGDTLNAVKLGIPIYNETNDRKFGMSIPKSVLLIRNKYKDSFFKNNQLSDGITSSLFDYSSSTSRLTQYTFNNITQMINNCLADKEAAERDIREKGFTKVSLTDPEGNVYEENVDNIEKWEELIEWDKFVLIPVLVTKDASSNSYYSSSNVISIQHDLKPGYALLKGGSKGSQQDPQGNPLYPDNVLKLEVISTSFGTKSK